MGYQDTSLTGPSGQSPLFRSASSFEPQAPAILGHFRPIHYYLRSTAQGFGLADTEGWGYGDNYRQSKPDRSAPQTGG